MGLEVRTAYYLTVNKDETLVQAHMNITSHNLGVAEFSLSIE